LPSGCKSKGLPSGITALHTLLSLYFYVSSIAALFCVADYWLFVFYKGFSLQARMTMVHDFVDTSAERPSLSSLFLLPKSRMALWINTFKKGGDQNENQVLQKSGHQAQNDVANGQAALQAAQ